MSRYQPQRVNHPAASGQRPGQVGASSWDEWGALRQVPSIRSLGLHDPVLSQKTGSCVMQLASVSK